MHSFMRELIVEVMLTSLFTIHSIVATGKLVPSLFIAAVMWMVSMTFFSFFVIIFIIGLVAFILL